MKKAFTNKCPNHDEECRCFCRACSEIMCQTCILPHNCPKMKKKVIEYIAEELTENFKFEKYLGEGSFGTVFKVVGDADGKIYALKLVEDVDEESYDKLKQEIRVMAQIKHPNIIKYYGSKNLIFLMFCFIM